MAFWFFPGPGFSLLQSQLSFLLNLLCSMCLIRLVNVLVFRLVTNLHACVVRVIEGSLSFCDAVHPSVCVHNFARMTPTIRGSHHNKQCATQVTLVH